MMPEHNNKLIRDPQGIYIYINSPAQVHPSIKVLLIAPLILKT